MKKYPVNMMPQAELEYHARVQREQGNPPEGTYTSIVNWYFLAPSLTCCPRVEIYKHSSANCIFRIGRIVALVGANTLLAKECAWAEARAPQYLEKLTAEFDVYPLSFLNGIYRTLPEAILAIRDFRHGIASIEAAAKAEDFESEIPTDLHQPTTLVDDLNNLFNSLRKPKSGEGED